MRIKRQNRLFRRPGKTAKARASALSSMSSLEKKIDPAQLYKMIRERAYYIWEERSKPAGEDFDIWLQAEKEMHDKIKNK